MSQSENLKKIDALLSEAQEKLDNKNTEFEKLRKSKLKIIILIIVLGPLVQYFPLRNGSLIEQYGFPNGLIYFYVGCLIIIPVIYYLTMENLNREIYQIERDISLLEKRKSIAEK